MSNTRQLITYSLIGIALSSLAGCVVRTNLAGAHVKKGRDNTEVVEVLLPVNAARKIRNREIYFYIVVVDCTNFAHKYPMTPYIAGQRAIKFDFPVAGEFVTVQGDIPERVLARFPTPCVTVEGGSYFYSKLEATPIPLIRMAK